MNEEFELPTCQAKYGWYDSGFNYVKVKVTVHLFLALNSAETLASFSSLSAHN